jgi:hypothetical protein
MSILALAPQSEIKNKGVGNKGQYDGDLKDTRKKENELNADMDLFETFVRTQQWSEVRFHADKMLLKLTKGSATYIDTW